MRLIDGDALIAYCDEKWIPLNIDAVNEQPTIEEQKELAMKKEQENKNEWLRRAVAKDAQFDGYDYKSFLKFLQLIHAFEHWTRKSVLHVRLMF